MADVTSRRRILDVATKLFSTRGLKDTNVRQIASKSKTNSALIFYYFGCKEQLFFECLTELATERFKVTEEILTDPTDARDLHMKLSLFVKNMVPVFATKKDLIKILYRELDNDNPRAHKIFERHFLPTSQRLKDFFAVAQKKKLIRKDIDTNTLAFDFLTLLACHVRNESVLKYHVKKEAMGAFQENIHDRVINLFFKGILAHGG